MKLRIEVDKETPTVILKDLLVRYGFRESSVEQLTREQALEVYLESTDEIELDLATTNPRTVARWLNPLSNIEWTEVTLQQALLCYLSSLRQAPKFLYSMHFSDPTPNEPSRVPHHVLYYHIRKRSSKLSATASKEDIIVSYISMRLNLESLKGKLIAAILASEDKEEVSRALAGLSQNSSHTLPERLELFPRSKIEKSILEATSNCRFQLTPSAAIKLAALTLNIDISSAQNPIREYQNLKDGIPSTDPFIIRRLLRDRRAFDLTVNFNGDLPSSFYDADQLTELAFLEGFEESEVSRRDAYSVLLESETVPNFYMNREFEFSGESSLYESFLEIEEQTVGYGIKRAPGTFQLFSFEELSHCFEAYQAFLSPDKSIEFSKRSINKLYNIAPDRLRASINTVRAIQAGRSETIELFKKEVEQNNAKGRELLRLLLETGFYMRGWDGKLEPPISMVKEQTIDDIIRVSGSLVGLEKVAKEAGKLGSLFLELPLFRYINRRFENSDSVNGLSIGEKIALLKVGDATNSETTCIRTSSSWLCCTAHFYMLVISMEEPFKLESFVHVG